MNIATSLTKFVENSPSDWMPEAASQLLELLECDEVESLGPPGRQLPAEEVAERLESKVDRLREKGAVISDGIRLVEDAVAHLRANEDAMVAPVTFEDSEGIRWFVLASDEEEIIACYTSRPFVEVDI